MKKLKTLLYGFFAAAMIAGCSDNEMPGNGSDQPDAGETEEGFAASFDMLMPNGKNLSRSTTTKPDDNGSSTSSDGTESGKDYENTVNSAIIVMAQYAPGDAAKNFGFIAATEINANRLTDLQVTGEKAYRAVGRIQETNLRRLYTEEFNNVTEPPTVYIFAFCNPTKDLSDLFAGARISYGSTEWIDAVCKVTQGVPNTPDSNRSIWARGSFLMNNVTLSTRALPISINDWENFRKIEKPFHFSADNSTADNPKLPDNSDKAVATRGPIRMERSVARFDFKDGSIKHGTTDSNNNTYDVLFHSHSGVDQDGTNGQDYEPLIAVQLQRMALVNMSNQFYYLKRVSADGMPGGADFRLLGAEMPWSQDGTSVTGNYVVGPYAQQFSDGVSSNFSTYFNYPFFDDNGTFNNATMTTSTQWDVYDIDEVLKGENDEYKTKEHHIWRYVTENVIPAGPAKQLNGISTGIVFKGKMMGGEHAYSDKLASVENGWDGTFHKNLALCLDGKEFTVYGQTTPHAPIKGNSTDDPILYYIDGGLYMTWPHLRQAAIQASVTMVNGSAVINRSNSLYRAVFGEGPIPAGNYLIEGTDTKVSFTDPTWDPDTESASYKTYMLSADYAWQQWSDDGKKVPEVLGGSTANYPLLAALREAVTTAGITMYQSSQDATYGVGYFCYYYYWNRHNDNGLDGVMGPMEFDVVRNNVYKLSVDNISRLGHPRIPANDPENPNPDTPDESSNLYIDVNVQVVPWAVRVNHIVF